MSRPRAMLITRNLPPLRGGMERLVQHIARALAERYDLTAIGPVGCGKFLPESVGSSEVAHRPLLRFLFGSTLRTWQLTGDAALRVAIAGSGLTAPAAWWAARRSGARFVVYLHGLDIVAPSAIYRCGWLPFIRRADRVLVNSANTRNLAIAKGVRPEAIAILHPGTDLPVEEGEARRNFRVAHGLGDKPIMLSVGRLTPRKGLSEFIRHALPRVLEKYPDAILLVIGADAKDAVRQSARSERRQIVQSAAEAGVSAAVRILPPCDDAVLSCAYRAADVYVFPVLDLPGDVEGFGMVAIEAAAHGLPTVGFGVGGVPDAIVDGSSGSLVAPKDYDGFAAQVNRWLASRGDRDVQVRCRSVASRFGWDQFGVRLHEILDAIETSAA